MTMFAYEIHNPRSPEHLADWVEFYLQAEESGEISKSNLASAIELSSGGDSELLVDNVWQSLEYRRFLYGSTPPYKVDPRVITRLIDKKSNPAYLACLIFTMEGNNVDAKNSGDLFEDLCNESMKTMFQGESIVYGFPVRTSLKQVADTMNEEFFRDPPSARKDRGVDLITWKPFGDERASQVVILTQCAAGHNWREKCVELDITVWEKAYINFLCRPLKALAVPFVYLYDTTRRDYAMSAGLVIDRPRIYRTLSQTSLSHALNTKVKQWCELRLSQIFSA